ncbi:hypothetical protein N0V83_010685, partial [Neocucurbitaria cava]
DKPDTIIQNWRLRKATVASIVSNHPQAGPDNALAQTVAAEESIIEEIGLLNVLQAEEIPDRQEKDDGIRKITEEIEEGPKR